MQTSFWDEIKLQFRTGPMFTRLLLFNIGVFLVLNLIIIFYYLNNTPTALAEMKLLNTLAPQPNMQHNLTHPWGFFLYMFMHTGFWHLLFNMVMLYFGGKLFSQYLSDKALLNTYIFGGLSGVLFFVLTFNFFPVFAKYQYAPIIGASASVMAILGAISFYAPKLEIMLWGIFRMRLLYLTLILAVLDFLAIPKDNPGGRISHLGGLLFGLYASNQFNKPKHFINRWDLTRLFKVGDWFKRQPKMKVKYKNPRGFSDEEYNIAKKERQVKIDAILDKINKSGYESLTKKEKDFLFNAGKDV